jgi:hypothetical protein
LRVRSCRPSGGASNARDELPPSHPRCLGLIEEPTARSADARLHRRTVFVEGHEHANAPYTVTLLRPRGERAAALPSPAMNSRRRISALQRFCRQD